MPKPVNELNAQFRHKEISIDLIDEPQVPERQTMDERELAELALSIGEVGLIEDLVVKPVGDRYEVIAGHRRLLACRIVRHSPVSCKVKVNDRVSGLAMLVHENAHREAVNAIEEARFYQRLLNEECGNDVDMLCIMVKRNRGFVEDRLLLLMGSPLVVKALHEGRISIAVARELNRVKDPTRLLLLLDTAVNQGATARQVTTWVRDANLQDPIVLPQADATDENAQTPYQDGVFNPHCLFCDGTHIEGPLQMLYMHAPCLKIVRRALNLEGGQAAQPEQ